MNRTACGGDVIEFAAAGQQSAARPDGCIPRDQWVTFTIFESSTRQISFVVS